MAMPQAERFSRTCAVTPERISVESSSATSGCARAKSLANATSDSVGNMTSTTMCSVRSAPRFKLCTSSSSAPTPSSTLAAATTIASPWAVSCGNPPRAIEQAEPELRFQAIDGLADRRLNAPQLARRRREAPRLGHRPQRAELLDRHPFQHRGEDTI